MRHNSQTPASTRSKRIGVIEAFGLTKNSPAQLGNNFLPDDLNGTTLEKLRIY
jgi:hypothetical protein